jgi:hypothetical protein
MAVINFREVLPRTFAHRFGEAPSAERKFVVTVDAPTPTQEIINAVGIFHGSIHPEFTYLRCLNGSFNETDRQHVEATFAYEVPNVGSDQLEPNPLARRDVWSFSTGGAQVPALYFYADDGIAPLANSAGDLYEGLTTSEAEMRVTISGNRPTFDYALASQVTNCLNGAPYLGGDVFTWMCTGITGQQQVEVVNDVEIKYWSFTAELVYRQGTHLLMLPDVGFNYIAESEEDDSPTSTGEAGDSEETYTYSSWLRPMPGGDHLIVKDKKTRTAGGVKKRAWVIDSETGERVPSANPVALNPDGSMKPSGATPNILIRRVHRVIDFSSFFGIPYF